ncbi:MAG: hypothetical protein F4246_11290 [Rhodothermaceae bacterium]|nr:hypothetical protein [Rhodothermaceae bacterium]MXX59530.1 hypothetical protein [Rhodothermaceae bacterium]MYD19323.1 hypothetical protein [Rhodothermaceae bacterium]MYD57580.1 hypothetical protein [Rhodothermaceae bacterium]MYI43147.1 hypothetical protein [Rhodothermaceae bacterium]
MKHSQPGSGGKLYYEPDDPIPKTLALGLGIQLAALAINGVVLLPTIVFRAGDAEELISWAVFASVLACGISAILQSMRVGRIGSGYALTHVSSAIFIAVCAEALLRGGAGLLATLVVITALAQVVLSMRLSLLRRILTPVITGTMIMLLPVTVMPVLFDMLNEVPTGTPAYMGPLSAGITICVILIMVLRGRGILRLWAPAAGIVVGSLVSAYFGIYDVGRVADAGWIGIPSESPPGLNLHFDASFWALLPAFLFVALVGSTKSIALVVSAQRVATRRSQAVNYRAVQRAVTAEGVGNLFAGLAGTMPNTPHAGAVAAVEITGVAARRTAFAAGLVLLTLAFLPKALAIILAIPASVVAAAITVVMASLFAVGLREVVRSMDVSPRNGLIAGVSFWIGIASEFDLVFSGYISELAGGLLSNGLTTGGLAAFLLTALTARRKSRIRGKLDMAELPRIQEFLRKFAANRGLNSILERMEAATEEALLTLLQSRDELDGSDATRGDERQELRLTASKKDNHAVLEFRVGAAGNDELNLQDQLEWIDDRVEITQIEHDVSLRLLRHLATSVRHQQFHDMDILTLHVSASSSDSP